MNLKERLQALMDSVNPERADICSCDACRKIQSAPFECDHCGYKGDPDTLQCACYDYVCSPSARGAGCLHGGISCPQCEEGEGSIDPWSWIKAIRRELEND